MYFLLLLTITLGTLKVWSHIRKLRQKKSPQFILSFIDFINQHVIIFYFLKEYYNVLIKTFQVIYAPLTK